LPLAVACEQPAPAPPAIGQLVVWLDTDAPLPTAIPPGPMDPAPLFDRVRVDLLPLDGTTCDCTREFDVTADSMNAGVSFGVVPPSPSGATLRVRLFRAAVTLDGEPAPDSTIDYSLAVPAIPEGTVADATVVLATDDVGVPVGTDTPIALTLGKPGGSHVGTWSGAQRVDCATPPPDGEVCIPGGAYWMGDPSAAGWTDVLTGAQRLVILSPVAIDDTEVTVATLRAAGMAPDASWSGNMGTALLDYCTFSTTEGLPTDALPVTCIDWNKARAYCQAQGKDLPTEAEFEFAAGGRHGNPFSWGVDPPTCPEAVFSRWPGTAPDCLASGDMHGGPAPPGSGSLDAFALPTGKVLDLAGNVEEWMRDDWNPDGGPCWSRPGVYADPFCSVGATEASARGGSWAATGGLLRAGLRDYGDKTQWVNFVGFRCARDGQ
jgi:formylglycine-generating enzyme required for sulfatase activity